MYTVIQQFVQEVSSTLKLLGREEGKINTFFVESPEIAEAFLNAVKSSVTYPVLLVEYPDETITNLGSTYRREMPFAFAVLAPSGKKASGSENTRKVIYEVCKPAADAIFSLLRTRIDSGQLTHNGRPISMHDTVEGNWVGPLHNDLYGWRIEISLQQPGAGCYSADDWLPHPPEEEEDVEP